jgi:tetratricopeptide (TPR) repeat protein
MADRGKKRESDTTDVEKAAEQLRRVMLSNRVAPPLSVVRPAGIDWSREFASSYAVFGAGECPDKSNIQSFPADDADGVPLVEASTSSGSDEQTKSQPERAEVQCHPDMKARRKKRRGRTLVKTTKKSPSPAISLQQIHSLSYLIASKWRQVAFSLKPQPMERWEAEEISTKCADSLQEQAMEMLQKWMDRDGSMVTVDLTCEVLITASCKAEAEEIFGIGVVQRVQSQIPDSAKQNPDRLIYDLADEVGVLWKELALDLGFRSHEIDVIENEARTPKEQAHKMLRQLLAKVGYSGFNVAEVRAKNEKIKRKQNGTQPKYMVIPQDDQNMRGREEEIDGIVNHFWSDQREEEVIPHFCLQIVNGLGGIGKSAVALRYAAQCKKRYRDGVFYFKAESYVSLHNSVRDNMRGLSLTSTDGTLNEDNQTFLEHVCSKGKVLLLYDGADNLDFLQKYLPHASNKVHVLVTTRTSGNHPLLARASKITSLSRLTTDSAIKALQAWRGRGNEELSEEEAVFAARLVSEGPVQGLPLAIAHAGIFMELTRLSCAQYYQLLKTRQEKLEALALDMEKLLHYFCISGLREALSSHGVHRPSDLSRCSVEELISIPTMPKERHLLLMARHFILSTDPVHLTWQLDIETVKDTDSNAMELLFFASIVASRNVPERLLRPLIFTDVFAHRYPKCLSTLRSHAIVDVSVTNDGYSVDLHPLVQSTILERILAQPQELFHRLKKLCQHLLSLLPFTDGNIKESLKDDNFLPLIPHLYATADKVALVPLSEEAASLLSLACRTALILQHIDVAVYLCNEYLKLFSNSADCRQRWESFYFMGRAFELLSNPQAAELHFRSALSAIDSCSAEDKQRLYHEYGLALGSLASCLEDQQMFTDAESLYQMQIALLKENPQDEENRREIAVAVNNLALNYSASGRIDKAIETYEQALEMQTEDEEPEVLLSYSTSLGNLGHTLMENGQFEEALPLLETCLSINRENLPEEHFDLAHALRELSMCCENLGDIQRALQLAEEALGIVNHCLPMNHPHLALYIGQLAACIYSADRPDEAIDLMKQSIDIQRRNLPSTRNELCTSLSNLSVYYLETGMLQEGIMSLEECQAAERSFLPPQHPNIGTSFFCSRLLTS